jgi:hypothetical protein
VVKGAGAGRTSVDVLVEGAFDDVPQHGRKRRQELEDRRRRIGDVLEQHLGDRLGVDGQVTGEHLVHDDAQGIDVRGGADHGAGAAGLFRAHVRRRAHDQTGGRLVLAAHGRIEQFGHAEVEDLDDRARGAFDDEDVVRLEIAVDDAGVVGGVEGRGDLPHQFDGVVDADGAAGFHVTGELDAFEELHDQVEPAVGELAEVEHLDDVRIVDLVDGLGFGHEAVGHLGVGRERGHQDLDGDLAADVRVLAEEDLAHGARAEQRFDLVIADGGANQGFGIILGHASSIQLRAKGYVNTPSFLSGSLVQDKEPQESL